MFSIYTVSKKIKWNELSELQSKMNMIDGCTVLPVIYDGQEIFHMRQPDNDLFVYILFLYFKNKNVDKYFTDEFRNLFSAEIKKHKKEKVNIGNSEDVNGFILRKICVNIDFEKLTNHQIEQIIHKMPIEVQFQIKCNYELLYGNNMEYLLSEFIKMFEDFAEQGNKDKKGFLTRIQGLISSVFKK